MTTEDCDHQDDDRRRGPAPDDLFTGYGVRPAGDEGLAPRPPPPTARDAHAPHDRPVGTSFSPHAPTVSGLAAGLAARARFLAARGLRGAPLTR